ncbi:MAG TPA: ABC transporter ATP-binding protein [Acidobacteriota bacterium]|nr:ABC transporter ATP-binding protein [Acidobacteriota bacterium]
MADLIAKDIEKQLGSAQVLCGVSFELQPGEVLALLGPSGSGKTTLLRSVAGLERPDRGKIEIRGKVVFDAASGFEVSAEARGLGLVFQSYAIWPHRSVFENVAYGLRLRHAPENEIRQKVGDVLQRLGLGHLADRYAHQLSGGQQQRVALARAIVYSPPVLLLDEPLSNLDAKLREDARAWLRELIKQLGNSALYVTHDQTEALAIADRVLLLDRGQIQQDGTPQQIYGNPRSQFTAEFMGSNNRFEGKITEVTGQRARLTGEGWSLWGKLQASKKTAGATGIGLIRVERLRLVETGGDNILKMQLKSALYLGERWEYQLQLGDLRIRMWGETARPAGEYWIAVPEDGLWIF